MAGLKYQAEGVLNGELVSVMSSLQDLQKPELSSVFGEAEGLLRELVVTIDGLKGKAQRLRRHDLLGQRAELEPSPRFQASASFEEPETESVSKGHLDTMMEVHVVGLSHHEAPVGIRERLAVPEAEWNRYSQEFVEFARTASGYLIPEVAVLSTCNRFEVYFASPELRRFPAIECARAFLRQKSGLSRSELDRYLFVHSGDQAVDHLFKVSSGLDSLVMGEAQILSQVKQCHKHAIVKAGSGVSTEAGSGGKFVSRLLESAIVMGKAARTHTKIGVGSVSVSSAAVELMMLKSLPDLQKTVSNVHICIVGAGKMSRLLLLALFSKQPDAHVTLVNRSVDKAAALLEEVKNRGGANATVAPMSRLLEVVGRSDVVFAATACTEPVLRADDLLGRDTGLMLVDIAVPRNIAEDCTEVAGVRSYSVDDLKTLQEANTAKRQAEVLAVEDLIRGHATKFHTWQTSQGAVPYLTSLRKKADEIRSGELGFVTKKCKGLKPKVLKAIDAAMRHLVDKLIRPIYSSMKEEEAIEAKREKISALRDLFRLEPVYVRRRPPDA